MPCPESATLVPDATTMPRFDLSSFSLHEMLQCKMGLALAAADQGSMEDAARAVARYLYEECGAAERSFALVRVYKTHSYGQLPGELRTFADSAGQTGPYRPSVKCLTLLATVGDEPSWNSRRSSTGHQAIPLPSAGIVEQAPMIAQLIRQMGLEVEAVINPSPDVVRALEGKTFNVFHVAAALDSPFIPAQRDFVVPYRIRSVLGFGGLLRSGDLFAVIMFSRESIPRETADRFRAIALDVKAVFFPFADDRVFSTDQGSGVLERG